MHCAPGALGCTHRFGHGGRRGRIIRARCAPHAGIRGRPWLWRRALAAVAAAAAVCHCWDAARLAGAVATRAEMMTREQPANPMTGAGTLLGMRGTPLARPRQFDPLGCAAPRSGHRMPEMRRRPESAHHALRSSPCCARPGSTGNAMVSSPSVLPVLAACRT
jgi:hypothetical protein